MITDWKGRIFSGQITNTASKLLDASPERVMVTVMSAGPNTCFVLPSPGVTITTGMAIPSNQKALELYGDLARAELWAIATAAGPSTVTGIEYFGKGMEQPYGDS